MRTFILDTVKGLVLLALIGVPLGYAILLFFERTGPYAPLWVWLVIVIFQLFMIYIAPVAILPLFNRYTPIEEGDLKSKISAYAESQGFKLKGIYTMDGSRRSRKSNAFFTGFGRFRRIVLFDTLVEKHDSDELLAILAHEIGHYKLNHIKKRLFYSVLELGISLFILSKFLNNPQLFEAFQMEDISVYASLLFFGFIYSPVSTITSVLSNRVSRSHEFDADSYSVQTLKLKNAFISALKKLSADNLSNLTPHRLKVFFDYSHPPVLDRIKSIEEIDVN